MLRRFLIEVWIQLNFENWWMVKGVKGGFTTFLFGWIYLMGVIMPMFFAETILKQMGNKQETKDKNQPFSRCFCQDSAKNRKIIKRKILDNRLIIKDFFGWLVGFEPTTFRTTIWRSNRLNYSHHVSLFCYHFRLRCKGTAFFWISKQFGDFFLKKVFFYARCMLSV